jgi:hypothetical protein
MSKSTCQRATQKATIHAYRVTAVHELKEPDRENRVTYCRWLQAFLNEHPGILSYGSRMKRGSTARLLSMGHAQRSCVWK